MVGCQKFVQYIRMLGPGRFILVESVAWNIGNTAYKPDFETLLEQSFPKGRTYYVRSF